MRVKIENLGPIRKADFELNGITVVGAVNGSGKSTIGRALYSTVKNMNFYKEHIISLLNISYKNSIKTIIERIENNIIVDLLDLWDDLDLGILEDLEDLELNESESEQLESNKTDLNEIEVNTIDIDKENRKRIIMNLNKYGENFIENTTFKVERNIEDTDFFREVKKVVEMYGDEISEEDKLIINEKLQSMKEFNALPTSALSKIAIRRELDREFGANLINYKCFNPDKGDYAGITITENKNVIFEAIINSDNPKGMNLINLKNIEIKDVTYIDNPFVIDNQNRINIINRRVFTPTKFMKNRNTDLLEKIFLDDVHPEMLSEKYNLQLSTLITKILNGSLDFNNNTRKYVFKENGEEIQLNNIATGFKSFLILDLLFRNNIFQPNHLLIIDEPEIHLHPRWQIEYAKLLIELVNHYEVKILINTHSTYFVEALKVLSEKNNLEDITRFYKIDSSDEGSYLIDVTDNIGLIYDDLNFAFDMIDEILINKSKRD